jgi:hypothetical protein
MRILGRPEQLTVMTMGTSMTIPIDVRNICTTAPQSLLLQALSELHRRNQIVFYAAERPGASQMPSTGRYDVAPSYSTVPLLDYAVDPRG